MSFAVVIVLVVVFLIVLIISGFYVTRAAVRIKRIHGYSNDTDLQKAHKNVTYGAVITWIAVGLLVLIIFGMVYFGSETAGASFAESRKNNKGHPLMLIFICVCGILGFLNGVLAAIAARDMKRSSNFDRSNSEVNSAYIACIVAASTGIGSVGLLILIFLVYAIYNHRNKETTKENTEERVKAQGHLIAEETEYKRELMASKTAPSQVVVNVAGTPGGSSTIASSNPRVAPK
jgi:Na+/proline symporter